MKELVGRGNIESKALIQYIIDGIADDVNSKLVLYSVTDLQDFKKRFKTYESIKKKHPEKSKNGRKEDCKRTDFTKKGQATGKIQKVTQTNYGSIAVKKDRNLQTT